MYINYVCLVAYTILENYSKSQKELFRTATVGFEICRLINIYSLKWRWIVVDIYLAAKWHGKYPGVTFTDTEVNNCFSIYHTSWITSRPKSNFICDIDNTLYWQMVGQKSEVFPSIIAREIWLQLSRGMVQVEPEVCAISQSGLAKEDPKSQINTLIYAMGSLAKYINIIQVNKQQDKVLRYRISCIAQQTQNCQSKDVLKPKFRKMKLSLSKKYLFSVTGAKLFWVDQQQSYSKLYKKLMQSKSPRIIKKDFQSFFKGFGRLDCPDYKVKLKLDAKPGLYALSTPTVEEYHSPPMQKFKKNFQRWKKCKI
mgnify:CR=1 FL=1